MSFQLIIRETGSEPGKYLSADTSANRVPAWAREGAHFRHGRGHYLPIGIVECWKQDRRGGDISLTRVYVLVREVEHQPIDFVSREPTWLSAF